ncbi:MAG: peptidylprolyl isomerase [Lachnospiraceae bacterium]|nr:peptidylprolyl isomerase [Lachnospiraceae bacterium]
MRKNSLYRRIAMAILAALLVTGCQRSGETTGEAAEEPTVVLTSGFARNEVFKIESMSGTLPEIMVYLVNMQEQYESVYGKEIWQRDLNGTTLAESVKDTVLANLAQVKAMNLLAQKHNVTLDEMEKQFAKEAAKEYYESLNETEIAVMQVDEELLAQMYEEYALANKVYEYIIKDINPEISDDEARTITVDYILIKTYTTDGTGAKIEYSEEDKQEARDLAEDILRQAKEEGSDFKELVLKYSEGDKGTYSFGKGETEEGFEQAAFNLATGEISNLVETPSGFYIIKCLSTFDKDQTSANKVKIVEEKREEVFGEEYDAFAQGLTRDINEKLWESISLVDDEEVTTRQFFNIYHDYFG